MESFSVHKHEHSYSRFKGLLTNISILQRREKSLVACGKC